MAVSISTARGQTSGTPLSQTPTDFVPEELWHHIFSYLSLKEKAIASQVCKKWNSCLREFPRVKLLLSGTRIKEAVGSGEDFVRTAFFQYPFLGIQKFNGLEIFSLDQKSSYFLANARFLCLVEEKIFVKIGEGKDKRTLSCIDLKSKKSLFTIEHETAIVSCGEISAFPLSLFTATEAGIVTQWCVDTHSLAVTRLQTWNLHSFHKPPKKKFIKIEGGFFSKGHFITEVHKESKLGPPFYSSSKSHIYHLNLNSIPQSFKVPLRNWCTYNVYEDIDQLNDRFFYYRSNGYYNNVYQTVMTVCDITQNTILWQKKVSNIRKKRVFIDKETIVFFEDEKFKYKSPRDQKAIVVSTSGEILASIPINIKEGQITFFKVLEGILVYFVANRLFLKSLKGEPIGRPNGYNLELSEPVVDCFLSEKGLHIVTANKQNYEISLFDPVKQAETKFIEEWQPPNPFLRELSITIYVCSVLGILFLAVGIWSGFHGPYNLSLSLNLLSLPCFTLAAQAVNKRHSIDRIARS